MYPSMVPSPSTSTFFQAPSWPFTETSEVIGGFAILEAPTMDRAVELTKRFLQVHGTEWDLECEIRQMEGPEFGTDV